MVRIDVNVVLDNECVAIHTAEMLKKDRKSWLTRRHSHPNSEYEVHYILTGQCTVSINERRCQLSAGQAIIIAPGQYHLPSVESEEFERITMPLSVHPGRLSTLIGELVPDFLCFPITEEIRIICRAIGQEIDSVQPFRSEMLSALYTQLVVATFRSLGVAEQNRASHSLSDVDWRTQIIDDFFEKNFSGYGTEVELADMLHLSKRQLARVLNEKYGMSYREKLLSTRMDHAGWLLRTTDYRVGEISTMVGYSSEGSFFKSFSRYYKLTPQKYRAAFRLSGGDEE